MYELDDIDEAIEAAKEMEVVKPEKKKEEKVTISLDEYIRLNLVENDFDLLIKTLLNNAKYRDYIDGNLSFDDDKVCFLLSIIVPDAYAESVINARNEVKK